MTAVGVWVGGLLWLLLGLRGRDQRAARRRPSPCSRASRPSTLVVVLATGLARALVEVRLA